MLYHMKSGLMMTIVKTCCCVKIVSVVLAEI
jgi:hypothetical protein